MKKYLAIVAVVVVIASALLLTIVLIQIRTNLSNSVTKDTTISNALLYSNLEEPKIKTEIIISNLNNPWDIGFIDTDIFIFTERENKINLYKDGKVTLLASPSDTFVSGEGGMLGLAIDPEFKQNRYIYTCFNSIINTLDVRVVRWTLSDDYLRLNNRKNIVTGIESNITGRHSGCQLEFGHDGYLWIGTGDATNEQNPQNPKSLNGKILRVDRDGNAVLGNLTGEFDSRIYSYGHRNTQGLIILENKNGFSVEHGSYRDDEINILSSGNFGWDPGFGYDESVEMTDLIKYPNAISALWSSGNPTVATSGGTEIRGKQWKKWQSMLAVAVLKDKKIMIMSTSEENKIILVKELFKGENRIRTIQEGLDGNLYFLTDNGSNKDKVVKITPY